MLSFLDTVTASSLLKLVRARTTVQAPLKGKAKENTRADDMEVDEIDDNAQSTSAAATSATLATQECATVINNLADLFQQFGTRDQPDIARTTIETLAQVTRLCPAGTWHIWCCMRLVLNTCQAALDIKLTMLCLPLHAARQLMLRVPLHDRITQSHLLTADSVTQACVKALMALLHTRHGSVRELSAVVLRQMTANILGLADSAGAAATKAVPTAAHPKHIAAVRLQALQFVQDVARCDTLPVNASIQRMFQHH